MTGSSAAPWVIAIVAFATLTLWLGLVFWAERHPQPGAEEHAGDSGEGAITPAARPPVRIPAQPARDSLPEEATAAGTGASVPDVPAQPTAAGHESGTHVSRRA